MKQFLAFSKKELLGHWRTGRVIIFLSLATIFGIMSPLIAKLTPSLVQMMAENLAEVGMEVGEIKVDAFTSWAQFYKNLPVFLLLFVLLFSNTLTIEYQMGTLVNLVTKGLSRWKVYMAKWGIGTIFWTIGYWGCYLITYSYTSYYWNNEIVSQLGQKGFYYYLWGIWVYSLLLFFSAWIVSGYMVLLLGGLSVTALYLLSLFSDTARYTPYYLSTGAKTLRETVTFSDYAPSLVLTLLTIGLFTILGVFFLNKKKL